LALTPQNDEAFLREVDDELRREQMTGLWKRYGRMGIGLVGLLLAAFAGVLFWQNQQAKKADAQGEAMSAAIADIQAGHKTDAEAKLTKIATDNSDGLRASALFAKAALSADRGDRKGAAAIYASIAADAKLPQPYRDLALIRQTVTEYDTLKPAVVIERLKPLAVPGQPWFGAAGELTAVAYLDQHQPAQAGQLLAAVARDGQAPASIRGRAKRLAAALGANVDNIAIAQKD
jgi:hypothetical protein